MTKIKQYLPYILAVIMFALGWLISPGDKVDHKGYEEERQGYESQIRDLNRRIASQDSLSRAILERMTQDSIQYADALKRKDLRIAGLTKRINEIDLSRATSAELDSIIARLYPD